eukprot:CAMPEP_0115094488 /NCGR_PEP_ID=MMETSP0227-20121206/28392_1 /TAXON_ID=89957 /ORGANISM="Polarella glacialis, Strain CCMP 1383" /LENGTH=217 /DNA_ID=CAMNT_0002487509 /DNA_START=191 /DNA_END=844 /DNA_ORIENTATION=+
MSKGGRPNVRPVLVAVMMVAAIAVVCGISRQTGIAFANPWASKKPSRPTEQPEIKDTDVEEQTEEDEDLKGSRLGRFARRKNATLTETSGQRSIPGRLIAMGPPFAACFVETWEQSRNVLEEWLMLDERQSVGAFRDWRQHSSSPVSVRCESMPPEEFQDGECLECVSLPHRGDSFREWPVQVKVLSATTSVKECMENALAHGGSSFCKLGTVAAES